MLIYLAGPMRGLPRYNFDAFEAATAQLRGAGHHVLSPAEHDIEMGFNPDLTLEANGFDLAAALRWDINAIIDCSLTYQNGAVVVLPGWEKSSGFRIEATVARGLKVPISEYVAMGDGYVLLPIGADKLTAFLDRFDEGWQTGNEYAKAANSGYYNGYKAGKADGERASSNAAYDAGFASRKAEVDAMSCGDWYNKGLVDGEVIGKRDVDTAATDEAYVRGYEEGRSDFLKIARAARAEGWAQGYAEGRGDTAEDIQAVLADFTAVIADYSAA